MLLKIIFKLSFHTFRILTCLLCLLSKFKPGRNNSIILVEGKCLISYTKHNSTSLTKPLDGLYVQLARISWKIPQSYKGSLNRLRRTHEMRAIWFARQTYGICSTNVLLGDKIKHVCQCVWEDNISILPSRVEMIKFWKERCSTININSQDAIML